MATIKLPNGITLDIPDEGTIFRGVRGNAENVAFVRKGMQLLQIRREQFPGNFESLPQINPSSEGLAEARKFAGLKDKEGASASEFQAPVQKTGEVISVTPRPDSPHSAVVTSTTQGLISEGVAPSPFTKPSGKIGAGGFPILEETKEGKFREGLVSLKQRADVIESQIKELRGTPATTTSPTGMKPTAPPAPTTPPTGTQPQVAGFSQAVVDFISKANTDSNADMQKDVDALKDAGGVAVKDSAKLAAKIADILDKKPKAPNLAESLTAKRKELGVGELETQLADADLQLAKLDADFASQVGEEEQRRVSMTQIRRRQSAVELDYNRKRRDLVAERKAVASKLDMKYGVVKMSMDLAGKDFEIAQDEYQFEMNKAIQLTSLLRGVEQDQLSREEKTIDNARANLQVVWNMLSKGNLDIKSLPEASQLDIKKMETTGGYPIGLSSLITKVSEQKDILFHTKTPDGKGELIYYKDGTMKTIDFGVYGKKEKEKEPAQDVLQSQIIQGLETKKGEDKKYNPDLYVQARKRAVELNPKFNVSALDGLMKDKFSSAAKRRLREVYGIIIPF